MLNIYFTILLICAITVPVLIHAPLKRKIKSSIPLLTIEIFLGVAILFAGFVIPFYTFFPRMPDYPKVTKKINNNYYFTQQEYGWAGSMPGKHLEFFKNNTFWFDKNIGHIQWQIGTGDINAKFENQNKNDTRIILTENNRLILDTILSIDKHFDFKYLSWRQ